MISKLSSFVGDRRTRGAVVLALALLLVAAVPVALAGWTSINTNNGGVDTPGAAIYTSACNNGSLADYLEIKNAWIVNDGSGFYFRLEACAQPAAGPETNTLRLGAGFDCNNDGDVADPFVTGPDGDRKGVYLPNADQTWLYSGTNQQIIQMPDNSYGERIGANYEWWIPLDKLYPGCRASTAAIGLALGTVQIVGVPQTRDSTPTYQWNHPIDYGDAINPDPLANPPTCTQYPTRVNCNGARHGVNSPLRLGALVDPDGGNLHGADANGDDLENTADEDGVAPTPGIWAAGGQGKLDATVTGGSGYLNCWVDWNADSDWADANERIVSDVAVAAGVSTHTFSVPSVTFPNTFTARCRLAPAAGQATAVTGAVEFGEVEDHRWVFGSAGNRPAPVTLNISIPAASTNVQLGWNSIAGNEDYLVLRSLRPYFAAGDGDVTPFVDTASPYLDAGLVGAPADALFYAVQSRVTSSTPDLTSSLSNRVGLFEFALTPGVQ